MLYFWPDFVKGHANAKPFSVVAKLRLPPAATDEILKPCLLKKSNLVGVWTSV